MFATRNQALDVYYGEIVSRVVSMLDNQKLDKLIAKTLAATLGRAGLCCPEIVAQNASAVVKQWVLSLRMLGEG